MESKQTPPIVFICILKFVFICSLMSSIVAYKIPEVLHKKAPDCESISFFSKKLNPEDNENSYYVCPCLCAV